MNEFELCPDEELIPEADCEAVCGYDFNMYMKDASKYPILTAAEEIELAKRIANGDKSAKKLLVESNIRLAAHIARGYTGRGLAYEDLVSEGIIGLEKAAGRFDYTKGFRFSTYASCWIKESISKSVRDNGRSIRLPSHVIDQIDKRIRAEAKLIETYYRKPTDKELAEALGITENKIRDMNVFCLDALSYDKPIGDENETSLKDTIEDEGPGCFKDIQLNMIHRKDIGEILGRLTEREQNVIKKHFGFDSYEVMTLESIAKEYNLSREGVRQIEARALDKIEKYLGKDYMEAA